MSKLSEYQKRVLIEDVYGPFVAAAIDQQKQLASVIITDPGNEEAQFAFKVADRLLGFLQTKQYGEFKKVPAPPVKIQIKKNNGKRYNIRESGGGDEVPDPRGVGEVGGDHELAASGSVPDDA